MQAPDTTKSDVEHDALLLTIPIDRVQSATDALMDCADKVINPELRKVVQQCAETLAVAGVDLLHASAKPWIKSQMETKD